MDKLTVYCSPGLVEDSLGVELSALGYRLIPFTEAAATLARTPHSRSVFLLSPDALGPEPHQMLRALRTGTSLTILVGAADKLLATISGDDVFLWLDLPLGLAPMSSALAAAAEQLRLRAALKRSEAERLRRTRDMQELYKIGAALSLVRDLDTLHELILSKARELTGADAGSLYLVEEAPDKTKRMRFKLAQNDSVETHFEQVAMPLSRDSIAGYVAITSESINISDAYLLDDDAGFRFNARFDEDTGYRSKSMLAVPMKNFADEVVGVIQLINCKRDPSVRLTSKDVAEREVVDFPEESLELAKSFASQAAVALENRLLVQNIENLFEGFVKASVMAIEARDPTTFGHSERVAEYTVALAEVVDEVGVGRFGDVRFSPAQLQEIEYAALLHDFGKIGVREHVLVKAKKLYEWDLQSVKDRFEVMRRTLLERHAREQLALILREGPERYREIEPLQSARLRAQLADLEASLQFILQTNEPIPLNDEGLSRLEEIAKLHFMSDEGEQKPLILPHEFRMLSIRRGTLNEDERKEIESHVTHTYRFLSRIPWIAGLKNVPEIAYAHHEKLNGSGYPNALTSEQIPLPAKMMTIADIYDALTAWDRPYKKAVPVDKALDILTWEARDGNVDAELLDLFIQRRVYEKVQRPIERIGVPTSVLLTAAGGAP